VVQLQTRATPPESYAPIVAPQGNISPIATGLAGLGAGALIGAGWVASRKFSNKLDDDSVPGVEGDGHKPEDGASKSGTAGK
jgi:hydrogenase small subunit